MTPEAETMLQDTISLSFPLLSFHHTTLHSLRCYNYKEVFINCQPLLHFHRLSLSFPIPIPSSSLPHSPSPIAMATVASSSPPAPPLLPISSTSPSPSTSSLTLLLSRLTSSLRRSLALARPWPELLDPSAFSPRPDSLPSAIHRLRRNLSYFRLNYSLLLLFTLSLSLLSHPLSLLLLLSLLCSWFFLYIARPADSPPLILLGRHFSSRETLLALSAFSFFLLFFTSLASLIIQSLLVGLAIVCVHGALRVPEDLFLDEQEAAAGSVTGGVGSASGLMSFLGAAAASATVNPASHV